MGEEGESVDFRMLERLYVICEAEKMDIEFMENNANREEVGDQKKGPGTDLWGTPVMTGERLDLKDLRCMN